MLLYAVVIVCARWLCMLALGHRCRWKPGGLPEGGFVLASNHQSYLDPIVLSVSLRRPVSFMARESLFRNPLFGAFIRSLGAFPVRRDGVGKEGLREAARRLTEGAVVLLFPEGTRSPDGRISPMKPGAALLSRLSGVPVVPAAVEGSFRAWPKGAFLPRPARVRTALGKPLPASRFREDPEGAARDLESAIRSLHQSLESR